MLNASDLKREPSKAGMRMSKLVQAESMGSSAEGRSLIRDHYFWGRLSFDMVVAYRGVERRSEQGMSDTGNIVGAFSEDHAVRLSGVSLNQLRAWDADNFFSPSYSDTKGVPYGRIYSFRDIVSLRVLNDLRNTKRIPLGHLRDVSRELSHLGDARWTATTLYVLGKRVVFVDPRSNLRQEVVSGQRVFDIPLRVVISSTRQAVQGLNDRTEHVGQVVRARFVAQNEAVIAGTRVSVVAIRDFADAGYSAAKIIREYPDLTEADIDAALSYNPESVAA